MLRKPAVALPWQFTCTHCCVNMNFFTYYLLTQQITKRRRWRGRREIVIDWYHRRFITMQLCRLPMVCQHLRRASSSCACLHTHPRPSWPTDCDMPFTTVDQSTWTIICCHATWMALVPLLQPGILHPMMSTSCRQTPNVPTLWLTFPNPLIFVMSLMVLASERFIGVIASQTPRVASCLNPSFHFEDLVGWPFCLCRENDLNFTWKCVKTLIHFKVKP